MTGELCMIGRGPSIGLLDWSSISDLDWLAVSSGITVVPWAPAHWVAVDAPEYFPDQWVRHCGVDRHVPDDQDGWSSVPNTRRWECKHEPHPNFVGDGPLSTGSLAMRARMNGKFSGLFVNSVLCAVQVAHRIGYRTIHFCGCDFTDATLSPIVDVLEEWAAEAKRNGFEWFNMSPLSHMQRFLPSSERMMVV